MKEWREDRYDGLRLQMKRLSATWQGLKEINIKKVKITILKTTLDKELAAEYGIDGLTACPMMKDDVRYAD